jgi:hypothetical protein
MGKGRLSIGDDTPSGEPENGPKGPYITDERDDVTRGQGGPAADRRPRQRPLPSRTETKITKESELGSDRSGRRKV